MKKNRILSLIIALFLLSIIISTFLNTPEEITPEGNVNRYFIKNYISDGKIKISYKEPLNDIFNTTIFSPRTSAYSEHSKSVIPQTLPNYFFILGITNYITGNYSFLSILFFFLLIYYLYKILNIAFKKNALYLSSIIFIFPIFLFWMKNPITNIVALSLYLIGFYYFLIFHKTDYSKHFTLSVLFFALAILIRYDYILLCLPLVLFLKKSFFNQKNIIIFLLLILFTFLPTVIINLENTGSPFKTGYSLNTDSSMIITKPTETNTLDIILMNFNKYLLNFLGFLIIPGFFLILSQLKKVKGIQKIFQISTLIITFLIFSLFSWGRFYGIFDHSLDLTQSHLRYYLPIYIFIIPTYINHILNKFEKKMKIIFSFSIIIIFLSFSLFSFNSSLDSNQNLKRDIAEFRSEIFQNTENDSIIFTRFYDKYIFPDRIIANYYGNGIYTKKQNLKETCNILNQLIDHKFKVYFIQEDLREELKRERNYIDFQEYVNECNKEGIIFHQKQNRIYEITKDEN